MSFGATTKKPREPDLPQLLAYAGWLLARREYTAAELLTKFRQRFLIQEDLFATALARLAALGLQSDQRAAESLVSAHAGWGQARLKFELQRRGVAPAIVAAVTADSDHELARAQAVLAAKLRGAPLPTDFLARQKLLALLARRGFSLATAQRALQLPSF